MVEDGRIGLAILFGGMSEEHEISVISAGSVWSALDRDRYAVHALGIARDGSWFTMEDPEPLFARGRAPDAAGERVHMITGPGGGLFVGARRLAIDVVFPVLHGPFGEDGSVQGVLELLGLPYVGSGVTASGVSMDKHLMKRLFMAEGLPIADYLSLTRKQIYGSPDVVTRRVSETIGYPCFVKPAALGSSVGITRVKRAGELSCALLAASSLGEKVLVERAVPGRELECSVLGNCELQVAGPGEVVPAGEFYDYQSKYFDDRTRLLSPAPVDASVANRARDLSQAAFRAVDARGMARVDLFYCPGDGRLLVNEINTIPGFTPMSMYPRLWMDAGVQFGELLDRLIQLALDESRAHDYCESG